jgi:hypothetical protein
VDLSFKTENSNNLGLIRTNYSGLVNTIRNYLGRTKQE